MDEFVQTRMISKFDFTVAEANKDAPCDSDNRDKSEGKLSVNLQFSCRAKKWFLFDVVHIVFTDTPASQQPGRQKAVLKKNNGKLLL